MAAFNVPGVLLYLVTLDDDHDLPAHYDTIITYHDDLSPSPVTRASNHTHLSQQPITLQLSSCKCSFAKERSAVIGCRALSTHRQWMTSQGCLPAAPQSAQLALPGLCVSSSKALLFLSSAIAGCFAALCCPQPTRQHSRAPHGWQVHRSIQAVYTGGLYRQPSSSAASAPPSSSHSKCTVLLVQSTR